MKTLLTLLISATCLLPLDTLLSQTIKTIKPAGGGDFTTLAAWEDWADGQTNADQWAECYTGGDLGGVTFGGWAATPNSNNYPKAYAAAGEGHRGNTNAGAYTTGKITTQSPVNYVRIDGLRFASTADPAIDFAYFTEAQVANCLINVGSGIGGIYFRAQNGLTCNARAWNNIIISTSANTNQSPSAWKYGILLDNFAMYATTTINAYLYNNTIKKFEMGIYSVQNFPDWPIASMVLSSRHRVPPYPTTTGTKERT